MRYKVLDAKEPCWAQLPLSTPCVASVYQASVFGQGIVMNILKQPLARYFALIGTVLLAILHHVNVKAEHDAAQTYFARSSLDASERVGLKFERAFQAIHQSASTMAKVPGIIAFDARTASLDPGTQTNAQQIFDSLVRQIRVSHMHVAVQGVEAAPDRHGLIAQRQPLFTIEPNDKTDRNPFGGVRLPVLREIQSHQQWFQNNHPTTQTLPAKNIPMIGGTGTVKSHQRKTLSHVILSVPFFSDKGILAGTVSAVISKTELHRLLPSMHFALVNTRYNFVLHAHNNGQEKKSARWVEIGAPDPNLTASNVVDLETHDPRSKWRLWSGRPNSDYLKSSAYQTISTFETAGYIGFILLLTIIMFIQWLETARAKARRATKMAEETRAAHAKTLEAERETRRLNEELKANMQMLSDTQLELVKHERLAALGQVTATLSHEIRNPLGAIRSSLYVIRQASQKAELKLDRPLDRIERSVTRCDNLIGDFLEYTRTNELTFKSVNAAEFLNLLLDDQTFAENITIIRDLPDGGPQIAIDPDRFRRVVINLVENAAQAISEHSDEGGEIRVSCLIDSENTVISVSDNGPGITDEVLGKIFEPLFTTKSFGAGLGLATVKQLVEQHDAELTIDTKLGVGTTFNINLKLAAANVVNLNAPIIEEKAA